MKCKKREKKDNNKKKTRERSLKMLGATNIKELRFFVERK